jgi:hypothetical protein
MQLECLKKGGYSHKPVTRRRYIMQLTEIIIVSRKKMFLKKIEKKIEKYFFHSERK